MYYSSTLMRYEHAAWQPSVFFLRLFKCFKSTIALSKAVGQSEQRSCVTSLYVPLLSACNLAKCFHPFVPPSSRCLRVGLLSNLSQMFLPLDNTFSQSFTCNSQENRMLIILFVVISLMESSVLTFQTMYDYPTNVPQTSKSIDHRLIVWD